MRHGDHSDLAESYEEIEVPERLRPFVDVCWFYKPDFSEPRLDVLVPEGVVDVIFNFGESYFRKAVVKGGEAGSWVEGDAFVGQRTQLFSIEWPVDTRLFSVRLKPESAYLFVKRPMAELTNKIQPLTGSVLQGLSERLHVYEFSDRQNIFDSCVDFLSQSTLRLDQPDVRLCRVLSTIRQGKGDTEIQNICDQSGFNRRTIERVFADKVGISPKLFARILRLHHFLCVYRELAHSGFASTAAEVNYYDQSHFIKEFKHFTGETPAAFFQSPPEIYEPLLASLMGRHLPAD